MGRPRKVIDWDVANQAAAMMCTGEEIASLCKVNYDTLLRCIKEQGYASFSEWLDEKAAVTKKSLRRKQIQLALSGHAVMLIWLGKNMLGQKDKHEHDHTSGIITINIDEDDSKL